MPETVFTLQFAKFDLYVTSENGHATGSPIYLGAAAESVKLTHRYEEVIKRPTGRKYPKVHHINEEHDISMERVWVVDGSTEFKMQRNVRYVMVITFAHPYHPEKTLTRTYYGVTNQASDLATRQIEFGNEQRFRAEYYL